jgi:regulator of replication initiation timing
VKESSSGRDEMRSQVKDLSEENEQLQVRIKKLEKKKNAAEEQRDKVATIAVQDADEAKVGRKLVQKLINN